MLMSRQISRCVVMTGVLFYGMHAICAFGATDAKAVMEGVYRQDTSHDVTLLASFEVYDAANQKKTKKFILMRLGSPGNSKTLVRFTDPSEIRGVALLSVNHSGDGERQWIYTPATKRVRSVATRERSEHFIGTDFTFEDVAERLVDDFTYRVLSEDEVVDGHHTFKIEAIPVDASRSQYKFIYYWVAQDVPVILFAEMYDQQGKKIRMLHARQLKKVSGIWGARHLEMSAADGQSHTVLTINDAVFNKGLTDALFTPEALEKPAAVNPFSPE
jgi:outer membrane lipoprotein-sorting protein